MKKYVMRWFSAAVIFAFCTLHAFAADGAEPDRRSLLLIGCLLLVAGIASFLLVNTQRRLSSTKGKHVKNGKRAAPRPKSGPSPEFIATEDPPLPDDDDE